MVLKLKNTLIALLITNATVPEDFSSSNKTIYKSARGRERGSGGDPIFKFFGACGAMLGR
jgi:hypothetical protein